MTREELITQYNKYIENNGKLSLDGLVEHGKYDLNITDYFRSFLLLEISGNIYLDGPNGYENLGMVMIKFVTRDDYVYINSVMRLRNFNNDVFKDINNSFKKLGYESRTFDYVMFHAVEYDKTLSSSTKNFEYYIDSLKNISTYLINWIYLAKQKENNQ